jgi:hypothetical protein
VSPRAEIITALRPAREIKSIARTSSQCFASCLGNMVEQRIVVRRNKAMENTINTFRATTIQQICSVENLFKYLIIMLHGEVVFEELTGNLRV